MSDEQYFLIMPVRSYKSGKEAAEDHWGGTMVWESGKAWPNKYPCQVYVARSSPQQQIAELQEANKALQVREAVYVKALEDIHAKCYDLNIIPCDVMGPHPIVMIISSITRQALRQVENSNGY